MKYFSITKTSPREAWKIRGLLLAIIVFGLFVTKYYPFDLVRHFFPEIFKYDSSCIILNVFNIPCPFCGMSRALLAFFHMDFEKCVYYNPASVIFFPFLAILCLSIFSLSIFNYKISVTANKYTIIAAIIFFLIIWLLNIFYGHLE